MYSDIDQFKFVRHKIHACIVCLLCLTLKALKAHKPWRPKGLFQFKIIIMSKLDLSASFEYLCYGSAVITNILLLTVRESTLDVRI